MYLLRLIIILNIWLGLFVVSIDLKIVYVNLLFNFQSSYLLVSASLFYQSCFSLSTLFLKSFFSWLPIFRCILVYHLYPGSSITFFKSFCCLFALVSRTSITIPAFIFIVNTFFIYFFKIFYMFLGIIFIHISTILYMSYFQYYK